MYSHDGIRDSLTHLAAPTLLYEELRRELARAKRENQCISLIRFLLISNLSLNHDSTVVSYSVFEEQVINFAHALAQLSRGEDICARIGELEFICVLRGPEEASEHFISRIFLNWHERKSLSSPWQESSDLSLEFASLESQPGESALEFLNRLDLEPTGAR